MGWALCGVSLVNGGARDADDPIALIVSAASSRNARLDAVDLVAVFVVELQALSSHNADSFKHPHD